MTKLDRNTFPHLNNLIGGWFNQDFDEGYSGSFEDVFEAVLQDFCKVTPDEKRAALIRDIDRFLALPGDMLDDEFDNTFKPDIYLPAWRMSARQWLQYVRSAVAGEPRSCRVMPKRVPNAAYPYLDALIGVWSDRDYPREIREISVSSLEDEFESVLEPYRRVSSNQDLVAAVHDIDRFLTLPEDALNAAFDSAFNFDLFLPAWHISARQWLQRLRKTVAGHLEGRGSDVQT